MPDVAKKIIEIVKENFPNGIRDDFIDTRKILRIYSANHDDENISQDLIAEVIRAEGIDDGGRFYFISADDAAAIKNLFDDLLQNNSILYYSAVHEKHAEFFARRHIFSPEVLKKILREINAHFCLDKFCAADRAIRLDYEVAKVFAAAENPLSLENLREKFPYVPTEKISSLLADNKKYLPTTTDKFIPASKIRFDTEEIRAAKNQIARRIDANGCAAPDDYDLSGNFALNPDVPEKILRTLIYEKFFAADFAKRGKRLFKKGAAEKTPPDSTQALRKFIAAQNYLPFNKLLDVAQSLGIAPYVALYVAHETMIRVEKDLFVADAPITFDVAGIDDALSPFIQGKIIALRAVTSFTGFPPVVGYSWNLFMLESFLRKFSRKYSYDAPAANSANVGAIYPKSMRFENYLDVQAAAVAQENIPLENSAVENFLVTQGFRAKRIAKVTAQIISRAQEGNF